MVRFTRVSWNDVDFVLIPGFITVDELSEIPELMEEVMQTSVQDSLHVVIESLISVLDTEILSEQSTVRDITLEELELFLDDDDDETNLEEENDETLEDDDNLEDDEDSYYSFVDKCIDNKSIIIVDIENFDIAGENQNLDIVELVGE